MRRWKIKVAMALVLTIFAVGCSSSPEVKFNQALEENSIEGWRAFLSRYSSTDFVDEAKEQMLKVKFEEARKKNTVNSYLEFLYFRKRYTCILLKNGTKECERGKELAESASSEVTELIPTDTSPYVKKEIIRLISDDPIKRAWGAIRLGEMGAKAEAAVPYLIWVFNDCTMLRRGSPGYSYSDTSPCSEAKRAVIKIGTLAVADLIKALEFENYYNATTAARCLGPINDQRAVEPLLNALKNGGSLLKSAAAGSLIMMKAKEAVVPLIDALNDKDKSLRLTVAIGLGKFNDSRAVEPLIEALDEEEDTWVRQWIALSLGQLKDPRAIEPLIDALDDNSSSVRRNSSQALSNITGKKLGQNQKIWEAWWETNKDNFNN